MSLVERAARWLPVLLYHRVVPQPPVSDVYGNFVDARRFESHLRWLGSRGYQSVSLARVADSLCGGAPLPERAVAITFDDGYQDNYHVAFPLLCRYGFSASVFIVTDAIGADSGFDRQSGYDLAPMLRPGEIREMAAAGFEFGSHTCSHPDSLITVDDERLRWELETSRQVLGTLLDRSVDVFSYPHSKHDARVELAVASAGYRLAFGGVGTRFDALCVSRVAPPRAGGPVIGFASGWRWLKWRVRSLGGRQWAA